MDVLQKMNSRKSFETVNRDQKNNPEVEAQNRVFCL